MAARKTIKDIGMKDSPIKAAGAEFEEELKKRTQDIEKEFHAQINGLKNDLKTLAKSVKATAQNKAAETADIALARVTDEAAALQARYGDAVRAHYDDATQKTAQVTHKVEDQIRANPLTAVTVALSLGMLLGMTRR